MYQVETGALNRAVKRNIKRFAESFCFQLFEEEYENLRCQIGILDLYHEYTTCVCFMGEGDGSETSKAEILQYVNYCHEKGYKCCLYSGQDTAIEEWMQKFDYVKLGSYQAECGSLTCVTTNQKMLMKTENGKYENITNRFWEH